MTLPMQRRPEPEFMDDSSEAEAYALADFADVNQAFADKLLETVGPLDEAQAIDLGTGPGDIPIRIMRARPRWRIVAVDASEPMLRFACRAAERAGFSNSIRFVVADAKQTGLPARSFDVVFSNSIIHHITEMKSFWCELKRIAAPGAFVFLRDLARPASEHDAMRIVMQYAAAASAVLQEEYFRSLLSAYTCDELCAQLQAAGLCSLYVRMVTDRHLDVSGRIPVEK